MEIIEKLKDGVCQINVVVDKNNIPENESLIESGIFDSFGFIEFISFIENEFNIKVEESEITLENFKNLLATVKFIEKKI